LKRHSFTIRVWGDSVVSYAPRPRSLTGCAQAPT
jgi:hypothetical protein